MEIAHLRLPSDRAAVGWARAVLTGGLQLVGVPPSTTEAAAIVQSELVTNAILHGAPPVHVMFGAVANEVRVEVHDDGHGRPMLRAGPGPTHRGLAVVNALATSWGYDLSGDGHLVWATIGG